MPIKRSKISWCDYSAGDCNFVLGCREVSPGCQNCYARAIMERGGRDFHDVQIYPKKLYRLLHAHFDDGEQDFRRGQGSRPIVFPCDMSDLFHPDVPQDFIAQALEVMEQRNDVDWTILTKRPERMAAEWQRFFGNRLNPPVNLWLGITVEDQKRADERIPILLSIPAKVRFLSVEPMLGPVDLREWLPMKTIGGVELESWPHWVICGAESGVKRRPFDPAWARVLREDTQKAGVSFFFKQNSGLRPGTDPQLDGVTWHQFPK